MKLRNKILAVAAIASTCAMISCAGPSSFSYQNVVVTVTDVSNGFAGSYINNMASPGTVTGAFEITGNASTGSCIALNVSVINAPANPTWTIVPAAASSDTTGSSNVGNFNTSQNDIAGTTITGYSSVFYCNPGTVPTYNNDQWVQTQGVITPQTPNGLPQGSVEIVVTNPADPNNPSNVATGTLFATITGGATVGLTLANGRPLSGNVTVPLCPTTGPVPACQYQFGGYVAGMVNNINNFFNPCGNQTLPYYSPVSMAASTTAGSTTVNVTLTPTGSGAIVQPVVGMTIVGGNPAYGIPVANSPTLVPASNTTITAVNITGTTGTITLSQPATATYSATSNNVTAGNFVPAAQVGWAVGATTTALVVSPGAGPYGTISSTGLYTAPTAYPPTVTTPRTAIVTDYAVACYNPTVSSTFTGSASITVVFP